MEIKGIIFDFFGVLSSGVADEWFTKNAPQIIEKEYRPKFLDPFDSGEMSTTAMFERLAAISGKTGEEVAKEWVSFAHIDWPMIALLKELEKKYKVAVCTNVGGEFLRSVLAVNNLTGTLKPLIVSSEVRLVKPHPEIYQLVLKTLSLEAAETVFIDDRIENIQGAEAVGIRGIQFTSLAQLHADLSKLGVS